MAIPCYNEAAAIASVVGAWRSVLPRAEIVVFDNNSTDGTGEIAEALGIRVVAVTEQGKGHAVRAIFRELVDRDAVILVDGDGTYPAEYGLELLAPILEGAADMVVGARRPVAAAGAMTNLRGLGNRLIRLVFRILVGRGAGDLLSGYRVFSSRFLRAFTPRSSGFEIETEIAGAAVAGHFLTMERAVPYYPRIAGTESKLRAFRDGVRILVTIAGLSLKLRPWRIAILLLVPIALTIAIYLR